MDDRKLQRKLIERELNEMRMLGYSLESAVENLRNYDQVDQTVLDEYLEMGQQHADLLALKRLEEATNDE